MKAGMIGLGAMGTGMAINIAKAGYLAGVYNRTTLKAEQFAEEHNYLVYYRPEDLVEDVDVVLICVAADNDVLAIVERLISAIKPDTIVVDMSTTGSDTAKQAAAMLAEKQAFFLDAPVSGGVEGAKNGSLAMMIGGDAKVLEKARPVLEAMANRIIHMGDVGTGQATKAVNQIMAAGINQAVTEALAFAQAQLLPMEKVIDVISGGAAGNWFLKHRGITMTQGIFKPGFRLALHHKDLKICLDMAKQTDAPSRLIEMTLDDYRQLMDNGLGDEDISALYRLKSD